MPANLRPGAASIALAIARLPPDDATRRDLDRVAAVRQLDRRVASSVLSADSRRRGRPKRPTGVSSSKTETGKSLRMQTSGRTPTHPRRGTARIAVNVAKLPEPLSRICQRLVQ